MHGLNKPLNDPQRTYSHAQKLRASLTYGFWKKGGRGIQPWDRETLSGNPSVSETVSSYMLGLHKRKVWYRHYFVEGSQFTPFEFRLLQEKLQ